MECSIRSSCIFLHCNMAGFAFGITTVALFVGVLPAFFVQPDSLLAHQITVFILSVLALSSLLLYVKKGK